MKRARGEFTAAGRFCLHDWITIVSKRKKTYKVGRDAGTGWFIPVSEALRRKKTTVVETVKR